MGKLFFTNSLSNDDLVQRYVGSLENGIYDLNSNTCVTNTMDILNSGGISTKMAPNGIITPDNFTSQLINAKIPYSINVYNTHYGGIQGGGAFVLKALASPFINYKFNTNKIY